MSDNVKQNSSKMPERGLMKGMGDNLPTTNILEQAIQDLSPEARNSLMQKAADEALRLQAKSAEIAIDEGAAHRETCDHIDAFNDLDKSRVMHGHKIVSEYKTGVGTRRIESRSGATCFVVTAACGVHTDPLVQFYRLFRDEVLIQNGSGRNFVAWYYKNGPTLARYIEDKPAFRRVIRFLLRVLQYPCEAWLRSRYNHR